MNEPIKLPLKITDDNRAGDIYLGTDDNRHMIIVMPQLPGREPAKAIAEYILNACNSRKDLLTACEGLIEDVELIEQDEGITACQCLSKSPDDITEPPPCNYCKAKAALEQAGAK